MRHCDHGCIETEHMSITLYSIYRYFANIIIKYHFRQVYKLYESACCLGSIDCSLTVVTTLWLPAIVSETEMRE